jgi:hypothetical protein
MIKYTIENNKVTINESIVEFEYPVQKVVEYIGKLIVLIDKPFGVKYNDNVFAVDANGKVIWQVSKISSYPGNQVDCPFVDIFIK